MRHVRQKLTLTPIRQLGRLPRRRILLNSLPQIEHHLVDLRLERIHLSARFDRDEPREVAVHCCRRDLCESTHLGGQVVRHLVHGEPTQVSREGLPIRTHTTPTLALT